MLELAAQADGAELETARIMVNSIAARNLFTGIVCSFTVTSVNGVSLFQVRRHEWGQSFVH